MAKTLRSTEVEVLSNPVTQCAWCSGSLQIVFGNQGKSSQHFFSTEEQDKMFKQICGHQCLGDPEALGDSQI